MKPLIYGRPTWVTVDQDALAWNMKQVRQLIGKNKKILAVVKADAYGHGAVACSKVFLENGADVLGVATVEEAAELRHHGIGEPVVVFGLVQPHEAEAVIRLKLEPTVVNYQQARILNQTAKKIKKTVAIQLKIDTGMGRIGFDPSECMSVVEQVSQLSNVSISGMFTHFANADGGDKQLLKEQIRLLKEATTSVRKMVGVSFDVHAANSAAVIESPDAYFDMVRPGLMLYGLYPADGLKKKATLKPALSWSTKIVQIKDVETGTGLSYGHTFVTRRPTKVATLPVGYADGYSRLLSNQGDVLIRGKICPVIGRVCMDMTLVDVTGVPSVKSGDEVVLIGRQGRYELTADMMAEKRDTIAYEVACNISKRVPRHFKRSKP